MDWRNLSRFVFLSAANNQITVIVVESLLFRGIRQWAAARSRWLGQLLSCDLCFGTWVGIFLALVYRPAFVEAPPIEPDWGTADHWLRAFARFAADAFVIALGGRLINELVGLMSREVAIRDEEKELLAEEVKQMGRAA